MFTHKKLLKKSLINFVESPGKNVKFIKCGAQHDNLDG